MFHLLLAIIYLSFISLGLPDGLLGAAWPTIYTQFDVPVSYSGIVFAIISAGTIISSLLSDRLTRRFGTARITATSVAITAVALIGFSLSSSFIHLCIWAIPYGIGAGGVDASINNYVALHYESKHMSWLHCMWGIGASTGPYIMGYVLTNGNIWNDGYRYIGIIQVAFTCILILSIPLWKSRNKMASTEATKPLRLIDVIRIKGAKEIMIAFFCYCALEQTAGLWASSYLVLNHGVDKETAASFAGLFFIGMTIGRGINGFIAMKLNDTQMIRMGCGIIGLGILLLILPLPTLCAFIGLITVGLGCAPIYPCIIHSTPYHFGEDKSQAMIGIQMASAYVGTCLMPPLFGIIANHINICLLPMYLLVLLVVMIVMHEKLVKLH